MKKIILIGCSLLALACCFSCKKTKSLSELRREERKSISDFIKDNNIEILDAFPADTVFEDNQYFLDDDGLYIQIPKDEEGNPMNGDGGVPEKGDEIVVNYYEITMSGDTVTRMWSPTEYGHEVPVFTYDVDYRIAAFNIAAKYLQSRGEANLIVPSKIGFQRAQNSITAYRYRVRFKIKG